MHSQIQRTLLGIVALLMISIPLWAHKPDQSYIYLDVLQEEVNGTLQATTQDLSTALGIEIPRGLTADQFETYRNRIQNYWLERIQFETEGKSIPIQFEGVKFLDLTIGYYILLDFTMLGLESIPDELQISYDGFFDQLPSHQGFVLIRNNWKAGIHDNEALPSLIYGRSEPGTQSLDLEKGSIWKGFVAMIKSGMWHIWIGLDHILFLLALVLPAVLYRKKPEDWSFANTMTANNWYPVGKFKPAFIYILKIVTLFTIAHSITLSLASFQLVSLPSWLVESIIALSIALAAFHNIYPFLKREALVIAFGFGLFHGFGFASVLGEVGTQGQYLGYTILGFNIGVELCQVMIIAFIFPILFFLRNTKIYRPLFIYGSIFLILISLNWFIERAFDVDLLFDNYLDKAFRRAKGLVGLG
ncbi:MAG: HupE/UreJ family protein [Bacteroidota bacterium]